MSRRRQQGRGSGLAITVMMIVSAMLLTTLCVWCVALLTSLDNNNTINNGNHPSELASSSSSSQREILHEFRASFYERYGDIADSILKQGVQRFGDIRHTAHRILQSKQAKTQFSMSFAGYSVTVGRGNRFEESVSDDRYMQFETNLIYRLPQYPMVLQQLLNPIAEKTLGISFHVINAAIGGIPSFPYGFCFEHFLGDPQVISWDYSMNEGNGAAVLEAYIRQSQVQLSHRPMLIVLDTNKRRCDLVREYTEKEWISDAVCVGMAKHAVPHLSHWTVELPNEQRPVGFQDWDQFGAPANCPGRGSWHPKRKEHELIAWMLAMYFVDAIEMALDDPQGVASVSRALMSTPIVFGDPLESPPDNAAAVTDLLYGHSRGASSRALKHLSCRTNFLPATDQERVLPSIVVSGLANDAEADIMAVRSDESYKSGWVLDVSKVERETKVKVENCGGLGYIDMKIALYGIPESGPLELWLPLEATQLHDNHDHTTDDASHWFDEVIVCEANEKRPANACQLDQDIEFVVGDVAGVEPKLIRGAAEYLKRPTCVHIGVPPGSKITRFGDLKSSASHGSWPEDHVGLKLRAQAKPSVTRENGACCISHVVWEQH